MLYWLDKKIMIGNLRRQGIYSKLLCRVSYIAAYALVCTAHYSVLLSLLAVGWAVVTAFSRATMGRHYLGDVVCGVLLGLVTTAIVTKVLHSIQFCLIFEISAYSLETRCGQILLMKYWLQRFRQNLSILCWWDRTKPEFQLKKDTNEIYDKTNGEICFAGDFHAKLRLGGQILQWRLVHAYKACHHISLGAFADNLAYIQAIEVAFSNGLQASLYWQRKLHIDIRGEHTFNQEYKD